MSEDETVRDLKVISDILERLSLEYRGVLNRLSILEGRLRSLEDAYCKKQYDWGVE